MGASNTEKSGGDAGGPDRPVCNAPNACRACLAASDLAIDLTGDQIGTLFTVVDIRRPAIGDILVSEGDYDNRLFAVAQGEFEVSRRQSAGQCIRLAHLQRGTITGELAFLDGARHTATVRAASEGACAIALKRDNLDSLLEVDQDLALKLVFAVIRSANCAVDRMNTAHLDLMR